MAKISMRRTREVACVRASMEGSDDQETYRYDYAFVLTDDGRVLRRLLLARYPDRIIRSSSYHVFGRIADPAKRNADMLRASLTRRGYTLEEEGATLELAPIDQGWRVYRKAGMDNLIIWGVVEASR